MSAPSTRSWLRSFLKPIMPVFREVLTMSFFVNILALAVPVFTMQVYDRVVSHAGISTLQGLVLGMLFVLAFDYVLRQSRSRILQRVALRVDIALGRKVFEKFVSLPLNALEAKPGAHWQSLFRDVDIVRNTLSGAAAVLMADLPFVILFFGVIFVVAPAIAWVLLVLLPIFVFVAWRSGAVMASANRDERDASQSRDSLIAEMIAGRTTIKALALERAIRPIWEERHAENIERSLIRGGKADGYTNLGSTLTMLTTLCLTSVGSIAIIDQRMTMGGLIATNMLAGRLIGPLNQLVNQWRTYSGFKQAAERLGQLFNETSERMESEVKLEKPRGEITVENVTFSYIADGAPIVDNVSLKIEQGGVNAMVGRNGSGKTTLLKILQGLYVPSSGRVLLDGADISQFSRAELATWIGYVPQENVLFAGTVRDNIAHRMPEASDEEVIQAAKAAGIHQFIIDQPDGYATEIGEAGQRLSGGQRQRISIARALVGQPPVLLLDEPSSSLDRQAEHDLRKTLEEIGKTCTVVIVTHSPVLLAACRDLFALDRGRVALAGPAHEILPRLFGAGARPAATPPAVEARPVAKTRPVTEGKPPVKPATTVAAPSKMAAKTEPSRKPEAAAKQAVDPSPLLRSITPTTEERPTLPPKPTPSVTAPSPLLQAITTTPVSNEDDGPPRKVRPSEAAVKRPNVVEEKSAERHEEIHAVKPVAKPILRVAPALRPVGQSVPPAGPDHEIPPRLLGASARPAVAPPAAEAKPVATKRPLTEGKPPIKPASAVVTPSKMAAKSEPSRKPDTIAKPVVKPSPLLRSITPTTEERHDLPPKPAPSVMVPSPLLQAITTAPASNEDDVPLRKARPSEVAAKRPHVAEKKPIERREEIHAVKPVSKPILRVAPATRPVGQSSADDDERGSGADGKAKPTPTTGTRPHLVVHEAGKKATGTNGMTLPPARAEGNGE